MSKIRIDVEALKANSNLLSKKIAELQALNARFTALIERIRALWEGNASLAYITKMLAQKERAEKKMVGVLSEYKKYVDAAVFKFTDTDAKSANKINGSF